MNLEQLEQYKRNLKISIDKIIREEIEMIFLSELTQNDLSSKVAFYGGTALRLVYNSPRFSEDIDLIEIKRVSFTEFKKFIEDLSEQQGWKLSDIKDKKQTIFALFKINDEKLKHPFSLKIEIHKPAKKLKLDINLNLIKSPVSILSPLLLVPTLENLKTLKEVDIVQRKKARDIFDLWYISQSLRVNFSLPPATPNFKERAFKNELQVFLPHKYYPIIKQLYEQVVERNK
ncbi:MAG: nucleotidyl transferase AbiEii/AbiGii toxin family protein [Candidatus Pacebacteria bacterium]|nr:nucleotidyl transferase AbiEii/AbiGii toxin family protein [Candidatus Paceibacterota bacterium]